VLRHLREDHQTELRRDKD